MGLSQPRVYTASFATGASISTAVDLAGAFLYVSIEVPGNIGTMFGVASTPIYLMGSTDLNGTYRRYKEVLTSTVTTDFSIASSVSNAQICVPYFNFRYVKLEASATVTGVSTVPPTFKIICSDSP